MILEKKVAEEMKVREVFIPPTKWNKFKLFFANFYETFLIILCLALSIYQDDASSFFFQMVALLVLHLSKKEYGTYVPFQRKISIATAFLILCFMIFKYTYMIQIEPTLTVKYKTIKDDLQALGYNVKTLSDGKIVFDYWPSLEFESFALIVLGLLIHYYNG